MNNKTNYIRNNIFRILILLLCIVEFIAFTAGTVFLLVGSMIALHMIVFLILILTTVWTLWVFDILWFITLKYMIKRRLLWTLALIFSNHYIVAAVAIISSFSEDFVTENLSDVIIFPAATVAEAFIIRLLIKDVKKFMNESLQKNKRTF